jgi:hypothetical protein
MGRMILFIASIRGSVALGIIVILYGLLKVESERSGDIVSNPQYHRQLSQGWQEKKKEFLYGVEKQIEPDKLSSSKSGTVVYKKHGPKTFQQEMQDDRGSYKYDPQNHHPQSLEKFEGIKHANGVFYDPITGTYIDPKLLIPVNNTTITSNKITTSLESNKTTTVTSTATIVAASGDAENEGLYYDPISGSVLSNSTGDIIPDSFYYYARKGNGGSKKSKKGHKKSCKKKKKGKGKGSSVKKSKKWFDECAYRRPNIHPDKAHPKECIYDYANHIRYCKRK